MGKHRIEQDMEKNININRLIKKKAIHVTAGNYIDEHIIPKNPREYCTCRNDID